MWASILIVFLTILSGSLITLGYMVSREHQKGRDKDGKDIR